MSELKRPWKKTKTSRILKGKYTVTVYDQPGHWMSNEELYNLKQALTEIAERSMDEVPTYGVFTDSREAYANRIIAVARKKGTMEPVAFTAMVYLPMEVQNQRQVVLHIGLTMVKKAFRGQNLQSKMFTCMWSVPMLNQFTTKFILTNIAASPAGVGSVSDYFYDTYPHYNGSTEMKDYHFEVATKALRYFRHEFGCSRYAEFDPDTFVVKGSNNPKGGGAHQFIKTDPVSKYKKECMDFCNNTLDYKAGDELFQVAQLDFFKALSQVLKRVLKGK